MSLSAGSKLGPYEILAPLGAGGMGEVYKARDTRLDRVVAIKVLPQHLSDNADLKQRFKREARTISSLNHPNICTLHDVGHDSGTDYLVLEFIDGESLAQRLAKGALPTREVLRIGSEIADALEKAHRVGIVHRDLKPGNIMLTKSGAKLLDFGLAKPQAGLLAASATHAAVTQSTPAAASSPITQQGTLVGTFQYMSPEQVEGHEADARSDIFALGAVLYEMATGRRAFDGKSQISVASAILEKEPEPITAVQPMSPAALDHAVRTCLAKNPDERWQSAGDVARQLRWVSQAGSQVSATVLPARARRRWERFAWASAVLVLLAAVGALVWMSRRPATALRADIAAPQGLVFDFIGDTAGAPALSPDGTKLVFGAHTPDLPQALYVRDLTTGATQRLANTESAVFPFWSPDSKWIAFFADAKLKKMAVDGGPVTVLADTPNAPRGGSWSAGDEILYTPDFRSPLFEVSASGGSAKPVTKLDESVHTTHRWPVWLPDGKQFLYFAGNHTGAHPEAAGIYFGSVDGRTGKLVVASDAGAIYGNGYILYHRQSALVAQRFDPSSGELKGEPTTMVDEVGYDPGTWHMVASASANGRLIYQRVVAARGMQLKWEDRSGKVLSQLDMNENYFGYRISPDGRKVAIAAGVPQSDIYVVDLARNLRTRLTFDPASHDSPSWSPDGSRVVYQTEHGASAAPGIGAGVGKYSLHIKAANGTGVDRLLYQASDRQVNAPLWSRDGRYIAFRNTNGPRGGTIDAIPAKGGKPITVVKPATPDASILDFDLSPDSRWIAYVSTESGVPQVYVSAFPSGNGRWQVSSGSGNNPVFGADGKTLYFNGQNFDVVEAKYSTEGEEFSLTSVESLFRMHATPAGGRDFDVAPDGKRFLVNVVAEESSAPLRLVVNWTAELKK
jgi:Tol biopolymer transport system component/tRNA A-37 threonylcarbamoyl transferase component Bud32